MVSLGVVTPNSSEELSYKYLQLLLHLHFRNIFAFFSSIFLKYFVFLFWNNFAWKDFAWKERKGSCSVHLLTNRESLDLNLQGVSDPIFIYSNHCKWLEIFWYLLTKIKLPVDSNNLTSWCRKIVLIKRNQHWVKFSFLDNLNWNVKLSSSKCPPGAKVRL